MHLTSQIFACNRGKLSESWCSRSGGTAFEWHEYSIVMWNVICWMSWERGPAAAQDLPWPCSVCTSRSQMPKAARKEMPHSRKFRVTKTTNKTKNPSVDACMTLSGHLTLHWMESIFSTKEDTSRKAIQKVASAKALGLALSTELDNSEPQLQIYHSLTNNRVTFLMFPKETPSQLWLKGDSTHSYVFNIHLTPLTIKL